jgi:DNA-binding transcriptional regulator YdaS (Cro superfamily)
MGMMLREYLWKNRWRFNRKEFAERVGVIPTYLSSVAHGSTRPSISLAKRIEEATQGEVVWHELMEFCEENRKPRSKEKSSV